MDKSTSDKKFTDSSAADVDATIGFEHAPSATPGGSSGQFIAIKQFRDLAFAAALLGTGKLTERHLVRSITNWTTHGKESLADHLVKEKAINEELRRDLDSKVDQRLQTLEVEFSSNGSPTSDRVWLSRLDRSGKLARMLGIADESLVALEEQQARTIGARYTLLRKLGQGGLGTVWLARDENLRRYVALKEITNHRGNDDEAMQHFRREAEITGRLEHPSIVPIYQFGTDTQTGRGFYAMRFLGKHTLHDAIVEYHERRESGKEEPMMRHRLITAFVNVCQAVAHAHSRNVIHRDLKPENIALDSFGQVVLLDWGLAKIDEDTGLYEVDGQPEPGDLHNAGATYTGRVLGTPLYMAPEQAAGRLDEVDHLTDIYGLGGILYAILTGTAPHANAFETGNNKTADVFSTIVAHPPKLAREIVPDIPPELDAICKKALSAKRYLRYDSASALAEDVQRYLAGTPVTAYETPFTQRLRSWMSRHPTTSQLVLLLFSMLLIGGAILGFTMSRAKAALQAERYSGLTEFTRELEVNLQFDAQSLIQDIHFVTDLPLMQDVIHEHEKTSPATADESAKTSLNMQGKLYDGLLRSNPAYLAMSTLHFDKSSMQSIVRAERFATGMHSHRVPVGQLQRMKVNIERTQDENDIRFDELRPGEVRMMTADHLGPNVPTNIRSPLVLIALSPVIDEDTGNLFGVNIIQLDLQKRLEDLFIAVAPENVTVYITDSKGEIAMSYQNNHFSNNLAEKSILIEYPQLKSVFEAGSKVPDYGNDRTLHATRVRLGFRESKAQIGVVVVANEE